MQHSTFEISYISWIRLALWICYLHTKFPAATADSNIIFWLMYSKMFPWQDGYTQQIQCKKVQICFFWLESNGPTPGISRTGKVAFSIYFFTCYTSVHSDSRMNWSEFNYKLSSSLSSAIFFDCNATKQFSRFGRHMDWSLNLITVWFVIVNFFIYTLWT